MAKRSLPALTTTPVAPHLQPPAEQIQAETFRAKTRPRKNKATAVGDLSATQPPSAYVKATFDISNEALDSIIEAAHTAGRIPRSTLVRAILQNWQADQRAQVAVLKLVNDTESGVHRPRGTPSHQPRPPTSPVQ